MNFQQHFLNRLRALPERDTQTFPAEALPAEFSRAAVLLPFWPTAAGGSESPNTNAAVAAVSVVVTRAPSK